MSANEYYGQNPPLPGQTQAQAQAQAQAQPMQSVDADKMEHTGDRGVKTNIVGGSLGAQLGRKVGGPGVVGSILGGLGAHYGSGQAHRQHEVEHQQKHSTSGSHAGGIAGALSHVPIVGGLLGKSSHGGRRDLDPDAPVDTAAVEAARAQAQQNTDSSFYNAPR